MIVQSGQMRMGAAPPVASLGRTIAPADRAMLEASAKQGAAMATGDPVLTAARAGLPSAEYRWGFDIGSAVCKGSSVGGPGQDRARMLVGPFTPGGGPVVGSPGSNDAVSGFNVAQQLQHAKAAGTPHTVASAAAVVKAAAPAAAASSVSPTMIGAGVVGVLAIAGIAYFLLR